jgi:hypothetical protein
MNCSCFNSFDRQEFKASYWENRGVTSDEIEILNFLKKNKFNFKKKQFYILEWEILIWLKYCINLIVTLPD